VERIRVLWPRSQATHTASSRQGSLPPGPMTLRGIRARRGTRPSRWSGRQLTDQLRPALRPLLAAVSVERLRGPNTMSPMTCSDHGCRG
jgi:hypothetical protein